jgi:hypothetical protein
MRIQCAQSIPTDPLFVLEDETQVRLERQVRADEDPPERGGIVPIQRRAVLAVIAGLETDVIGAGLVTRSRRPNDGVLHAAGDDNVSAGYAEP